MKRLMLLCSMSLGFASGCGSGLGEDADMDQAGPALKTALEFWKTGKSQAELEGQTPSILMNETEWQAGKRLVDFEMDAKGMMRGRQVRWRTTIRVQDKEGETREQKATYIIDTTPRIVIVRDTFADLQ